MKVVCLFKYLFILTLFYSSAANSQDLLNGDDIPIYTFKVWGHDQGLPASSIASVATSSEGYLWFATGEGLVRFDGDRFQPINPVTNPSLTNKIFHSIIPGSDGRLWSANINEIVKIEGGRVHVIPFQSGLVNHNIFAITERPDGTAWFGSGGDGIIAYKNGEFSSFNTEDGLAGDFIEEIVTDADGVVWIATRTGLTVYRDGVFKQPEQFSELHSIDIRSLYSDSSGNLWVGSQNRGIFKINSERDELIVFDTGSGMSGNSVHAITEAKDGVIWAGTYGNGMNRIDRNHTIHIYGIEEGLPSNLIFSLYYSDDGILWAGTAGAGLTQVRRSKVRSLTMDEGITSNFVLPIYQHSDGAVWLGTGGSGLNRIKDGTIQRYTQATGL